MYDFKKGEMSLTTTMNILELRVEIGKVVYYNEKTMFGIFGCYPLTNKDAVTLNQYNNFTIKGTSRKLKEGNEYDVVIEGVHKDPKYGEYYNIIEIKPEKLNTAEAQQKYLRAVVTERQAEELIRAYPNELIVDLIINNQVNVSKLKGIKEATLSRIKEKLIENRSVEALIAELQGANFTFNAITKIVEHYGSADLALAKVQESIYNLCEIPGFGFKKVDGYALARGEDMHSKERIKAAIHYTLLEQGQDGHTWCEYEALLSEVQELLQIDKSDIIDFLNLEEHETGVIIKDNRVSLSKYYQHELNVLLDLLRIDSNYEPDHNINMDNYIKIAEERQGFQFSDEQRQTILEAMEHGVYIINGKAGVGKTVTVSGITTILEETGKSYVAVALSGKAAQVLSQKGIHAMTIHRALGAKGLNTFTYNTNNPLPYDAVILDEASMVNVGLFQRLTQAIKTGAKFIIVGDSGQLSGIGHGDVLRDLLNTSYFKSKELQQIHRQASSSGIIEVASYVREGKQLTKYNASINKTYGALEDQVIMTFNDRQTVSDVVYAIIDEYKNLIQTPDDLMNFQVLVANRDRGNLSVKSINLYAQKVFNDLSKPFLKRGVYEYREGDKVIAKGNSYDIQIYHSVEHYNNPIEYSVWDYIEENNIDIAEIESIEELKLEIPNPNYYIGDLFNGTMGIIKQVDPAEKTLLIEFQDIDGVVCIDQDNLDKIQMAYAITIHSSQGSSIPYVVCAIDFVAYKLLSKQLIYTGITRSSKKCVLLAENNALHKAISTDLSGDRRTHLADLIADIDNLKQQYQGRISG